MNTTLKINYTSITFFKKEKKSGTQQDLVAKETILLKQECVNKFPEVAPRHCLRNVSC